MTLIKIRLLLRWMMYDERTAQLELRIEELESKLNAWSITHCDEVSGYQKRIEELEARHEKFLHEFWKTNAENEQLRAALENHYCELCGCAECLERAALQETDDE